MTECEGQAAVGAEAETADLDVRSRVDVLLEGEQERHIAAGIVGRMVVVAAAVEGTAEAADTVAGVVGTANLDASLVDFVDAIDPMLAVVRTPTLTVEVQALLVPEDTAAAEMRIHTTAVVMAQFQEEAVAEPAGTAREDVEAPDAVAHFECLEEEAGWLPFVA